MRKGTVLFMLATWSRGGIERVCATLAKGLVDAGWTVWFGIGAADEGRLEIPPEVNTFLVGGYLPPGKRWSWVFLKKTYTYLRRISDLDSLAKPDIVVAVDFYSAWMAWLRFRVPVVFWFHNSVSRLYAKSQKWLLNKWLIKRLAAVVALNESMAAEVRVKAGHCVPVVVIQNPLTVEKKGLLYSPGCGRFVFVGRIDNAQKRLDRVIHALSRLTEYEWEFLILGKGPDEFSLAQLIENKGLARRVRFTGWVDDPWSLIVQCGGAEALVLASDYEGHGLVLTEAMYQGLPCVATNCPVGPSEIISEGENGFLVPLAGEEETVRLLADKLRLILEGYEFDPHTIIRSVERYLPERVVEKWDRFLSSLMVNNEREVLRSLLRS